MGQHLVYCEMKAFKLQAYDERRERPMEPCQCIVMTRLELSLSYNHFTLSVLLHIRVPPLCFAGLTSGLCVVCRTYKLP